MTTPWHGFDDAPSDDFVPWLVKETEVPDIGGDGWEFGVPIFS